MNEHTLSFAEAGLPLRSDAVDVGDDAHAPDDLPRLDGYQITGRLGHGGMGTVWRAWQLSTRREVALKLLNFSGMASDKAKRRFDREVEVTGRLQHPNIARVYDSGIHLGVYFYAMELIDGVSLDRHVRERHLSQREILSLIAAICAAVQHAHQRGVIHRDLKPSNILVDVDGQPHVVDFGLGKCFDDSQAGTLISIDGERAGTPAYMSPEQAAGKLEQLDTRTDVYSLGVILYELLTGRMPYDTTGGSTRLMQRVIDDDVARPRSVVSTIDGELESLILKALAKDADDRYPSAGAMGDDVENYLKGEPLTARRPTAFYFLRKKVRKHRLPIGTAAVILLTLIGASVYGSIQVSRERDRAVTAARAERTLREVAEIRLADGLTSWAGELGAARKYGEAKARYHDAYQIYQAEGIIPTATGIGLATCFERAPVSLASFSFGSSPITRYPRVQVFFSGDGQHASWADPGGHFNTYSLLTGEVVRSVEMAPAARATTVTFTADGKHLMLLCYSEAPVSAPVSRSLEMRNASDGGLVRRLSIPFAVNTVIPAAFSGNGRFAAVARERSLAVFDLESGGELPAPAVHPRCSTFVPDGRVLLTCAQQGQITATQTMTGNTIWQVQCGLDPVSAIACAPDGRTALIGGEGMVLIDTATGAQLAKLRIANAEITALAISPDGRYALAGESRGMLRLWDLSSGESVRTFYGHHDEVLAVSFSPDGHLASSTGRDETIRFWPIALPEAPGNPEAPAGRWPVIASAFSADGRLLAVARSDKIEVIDCATTKLLYPIAVPGAWALSFAPDGSLLAGTMDGEVVRVDARTARQTLRFAEDVVLNPPLLGRFPTRFQPNTAFSPDGSLAISSCIMGSQLWDVRGGGQWLALLDREAADRSCFSRDGRFAAIVVTSRTCRLKVLDLDTQRIISQIDLEGHDSVGALTAAPMAPVVFVGHDDGTIRAINIDSGTEIWSVAAHDRRLRTLACSADGRYLLSGADDGVARLWYAETGREIQTVSRGDAPMVAAAFSAAGDMIFTAASDGTDGRLWDLALPFRLRDVDENNAQSRMRLRNDERPALAIVPPPSTVPATRPSSARFELSRFFADCGMTDWAASILEPCRGQQLNLGALHVEAARAFWRAGLSAEAKREYQHAFDAQEMPGEEWYLTLCRDASARESQ